MTKPPAQAEALRRLHLGSSLLTLAASLVFFSGAVVALFGTQAELVQVRQRIAWQGLPLIGLLLASSVATGWALARGRSEGLLGRKKTRMPMILVNGLLVLAPAALLLDRWAVAGRFDALFYTVQAVELMAAVFNLTMMGLSTKDGMRVSGRVLPAHGRHPLRLR